MGWIYEESEIRLEGREGGKREEVERACLEEGEPCEKGRRKSN